jgi:hypothetical protein
MSEDTTFRMLKRIPFDEMYKRVEEAFSEGNGISPIYKLGTVVVERKTYYNPLIVRHYAFVKVLEEGSWTIEEFAIECEKKAIIEQVKTFNDENQIPQEIINRAKQFFPNAKFIHAHVELE